MGRISTCFLLMELTSVFVLSSPANGLSLSVEDRLHQLTKVFALMELKMSRLEEIVQHQETEIAALQQKEKSLNEFIPSHLALNDQRPMGKAVSFPRTCRELRSADPTLSSGLHFIDPDGQGVGDDPIQVYCDMTKGSTSIVHDTESAMDVGHCAEPGCYSRPVNYNSTMRQIKALFELSNECHQSIQYDCNYAPLQLNGISYAWWNDRNGTAQYFWSGANSSVHTCQCGIENNCVEPSMPCNCDSTVPVPLTDKGVISDKSFLPITRLNFGRTQLASSSGIHTLGRLECTGQVAVTGMPKSCADLWRIGHSLSGIYYIMGTEFIEPVYCDFSKLPTESGFQTKVDANAQPIYFYVQRSSSFSTYNTPITFELTRLNVGNAMNAGTGTFIAPRKGIYFFSFSGIGNPDKWSHSGLYVNGNRIGSANENYAGGAQTFSLQSTLQLNANDNVTVQIFEGDGALLDDGNHYTHFTGFLLHTL